MMEVVKFYGIKRNLDELNRITIPKELRDSIGIHPQGSVDCILVRTAQFGEGAFVRNPPEDTYRGRNVDKLGRVTIPYKIARYLGMEKGESVEMMQLTLTDAGDGIFIRKAE